jgi:hypothetical protein
LRLIQAKSSLDDPAFGQDLEARCIGSLHNLPSPCPGAPSDERHLLACVSAISEDALDEREHSLCPTQQLERTITVLNISRMDDDA